MIGVAFAVLTSACGDDEAGSRSTAETIQTSPSTTVVTPTLTSIPFCPEAPPEDDVEFVNPTPEQLAQYPGWGSEVDLDPVTAYVATDPSWAGLYYDDASRSHVFRFTTVDAERDAKVAELYGDPGFGLIIEIVDHFSIQERQAAHDVLLEAYENDQTAVPMVGIGVDGKSGFVEIDLADLDEAHLVAEKYDLPPPYDIYCITPFAVIN